ncbi:hypothetical protein CLOM_g14243, partial [Closterium sp. NIES-68]
LSPACRPDQVENDAVLVVADRLMKTTHFTPCRTMITAEETARMFISLVVRLYGIPTAIISDRDPKFTSRFCKTRGTDMTPAYSSHPPITRKPTDRQNGRIRLWNS